MEAVTPREASPRMTAKTAQELVDLANKTYEDGAAITVIVWVGALAKHVTNEADAQVSIQRMRTHLAKKES